MHRVRDWYAVLLHITYYVLHCRQALWTAIKISFLITSSKCAKLHLWCYNFLRRAESVGECLWESVLHFTVEGVCGRVYQSKCCCLLTESVKTPFQSLNRPVNCQIWIKTLPQWVQLVRIWVRAPATFDLRVVFPSTGVRNNRSSTRLGANMGRLFRDGVGRVSVEFCTGNVISRRNWMPTKQQALTSKSIQQKNCTTTQNTYALLSFAMTFDMPRSWKTTARSVCRLLGFGTYAPDTLSIPMHRIRCPHHNS